MNKLLALFAGLLVTAAAHAASVHYDLDTTADTSDWRQWAWKRPPQPSTTIAEDRIRRTLEDELSAKGFRQVESLADADFLVDWHAAVGRDIRLDESWGGFLGRRNLRVSSYAKGMLIVDAYDPDTRHLVWRGTVSDGLASKPDKADKRTEEAITKLLRSFPSPPTR